MVREGNVLCIIYWYSVRERERERVCVCVCGRQFIFNIVARKS